MKRAFFAFAVTLSLAAPSLCAQESYISDELFIYMHAGPGTEYRILGSINAGVPVKVVGAEKSGYNEIVDARNRRGWVDSKYVTSTPSLKSRLPALENELTVVKSALSTASKDAAAKNQGLVNALQQCTEQVKTLEKEGRELNEQLDQAQSQMREMRARLDTQKDDLLMSYFAYGGMVAGGGLLFGLFLPHIIPRRKKNKGSW